ncbi:hypothetical protein [Streptomyces sp. PTY087I2]|uniref:hypothetical protein n=1 Tax=Streptomyces sp. PTY087I2 TaxID=1819298 RepID=UPI00080B77FF|nr:hypothetical protein [Streptomyces sp. PTY087I2]OCC12514.1 hypothetical protein A3Q37_01669 [Streptomyces sp. PTY087I2]
MTAPLEADPYLLPLPSAATPVFPEHLVVARHAHLNSRYGDAIWPLAPIIDDPSMEHGRLAWASCPDGFREELRLITWTFFNGELRNTFVRDRGSRLRTRLAPGTARNTVYQWWGMADWLHSQGHTSFTGCDRGTFSLYAAHLRKTITTRGAVRKALTAVTRLWAFDQLSARPIEIRRPPWDEEGMDDYLPAASPRGPENAREPLSEEVMGPLLVWALRLVDDLADDIIAAHKETVRLDRAALTQPSTPEGRASLRSYLTEHLAERRPLPSTRQNGKTALARQYIAGVTGASLKQVALAYRDRGLGALVTADPGPCPLDIPVTGQIAGRPWRSRIDYTETSELLRHLITAVFIVCAYLTGARTQEVLAMRSGCCPDPEDGQGRHLMRIQPDDVDESLDDEDELDDGLEDEPHLLIRSRHFKTATDPDTGNYLPSGAERAVPWVAIVPVVNAIRVLERLVPEDDLLFGASVHNRTHPNTRTGSLIVDTIRTRIEDFVTWANVEADAHDLPGEVIPPDPHGKIGLGRFRRSLAWHIARRPGGLVALAIQYGHMRTVLNTDESGRYGSRSRSGIHQLVDIETALATADAAADLAERFEAGEGISGPAARRALFQATTGPMFQGGLVKRDFPLKHSLARRHLARDGSVLYDNPQALLLCLFRSDRAPCQEDGRLSEPTLDRCVPNCGNIVRTDRQAIALRERAHQLEIEADHVPGPLADRGLAAAQQFRDQADEHDRTRFSIEDITA